MQRETVGWLLLIVALILFACLVARTGAFREGFQAAATQPFRLLNSKYPFKEVFLVAPIDSVSGFQVQSGAPDTSKGYTKEEAAAKCAALGGTLASYDQAKMAYDLSGHWCGPGWVQDRSDKVYASITAAGFCSGDAGSLKAQFREVTAPAGTKAFAICYAEKPPEPTRDVVPFNRLRYSMISDEDMAIMQSGYPVLDPPDSTGLSPARFTADQVRYAFDTAYFNANPAVKYDPKALRAWLVTNYRTVTNSAQDTINTANNEPANRDQGWDQARPKTCSDLRGVQTKILENIRALRNVMRAIKADSMTAVKAKVENGTLQRTIQSVCAKVTNAAASPACSRLAVLDSDMFYKDVATGAPNLLQRLEDMNFTLGARECEFQQVLGALENVAAVLKCDLQRSADDAALLGQNPYLEPGTCPKGLDDNSPNFLTKRSFGLNDVELLKLALMEISPFYTNPAFTQLINATLTEVSYILRVPQLNDYNDAVQNFDAIQKMLDSIRALVPTIA